MAKEFDYIHGFEDLRKDRMLVGSREHKRRVSKGNWKKS